MSNPILAAPAVREARDKMEEAAARQFVAGADFTEQHVEDVDRATDAYAAAILAEVKRRVEAMEPVAWIDYNVGSDRRPSIDRAAVLRVLDGGDDA